MTFLVLVVNCAYNSDIFNRERGSNVHFKTIRASNSNYTIEIPDTCPHCGKNMESEQINDVYDRVAKTVALIFRCSINDCHKYFILEYSVNKTTVDTIASFGQLIQYSYNGFQEPAISENIKNLSPVFSETFVEASIAEAKKLTNISGIAYRKAFEFLVKDFASYQNQEKIEEIRTNSLNNVIDMFYKDIPMIKDLLHITRRIGNDETHYYREFTDIDIKDMKKLIYNFSLYINMILDIKEFSQKTN